MNEFRPVTSTRWQMPREFAHVLEQVPRERPPTPPAAAGGPARLGPAAPGGLSARRRRRLLRSRHG